MTNSMENTARPKMAAARQLSRMLKEDGYPVSEQALRWWINSGAIPSVRIGKKRLATLENVEKFLNGEATGRK